MSKPLILITRTRDEAAQTADMIETRGGQALIAPLRRVEAVFSPPPPKPALLIATSANAFRHGHAFPADWATLPVLTVGDKTANAARAAGFLDVASVNGDAKALIAVLDNHPSRAPLVYLTGEPRKPLIEEWLDHARIPHHVWLRYRMAEVATLPDALATALDERKLSAILHFSSESALSLVHLSRAAGLGEALYHPRHICLSHGIASTLQEALPNFENQPLRLHVSEKPRGDSLIDACFASFA